jgi:hypothetical protein
MKWSKLKSLVESRFAPSVAKRIAIYSTRYGNCTCGRAWLTLDGKEIANFCTRAYFNRKHKIDRVCQGQQSLESTANESQSKPFGCGELTRQDAYAACWAFIHELSIEQAIADSDPLVQSLAILDSRMGKNRLARLDETRLHPLARKLMHTRIEAEKKQSA